ncbi:MAG: bifunctional UDP-N-acetylglucosamine diphosphorylase/glucosamine-1-phosphate N-acetyltransferase GlmU [Ignavibacteriales bacterium]
MQKVAAIVLAAGLGTRMKSSLVKTMHPLRGKPLITYSVNTAKELEPARLIVVVGHQAGKVMDAVGPEVAYAVQREQKGTAHAVMQAVPLLQGFDGDVVVLYADMPLLPSSLVRRLIERHSSNGCSATVLTSIFTNPSGYGRVIRDAAGEFLRVVEDRDCSPAERSINEINTGVYCFTYHLLLEALDRVRPENAQGEFYLTDVLGIMQAAGHRVGTVTAEDETEVAGINDRKQLAWAEKVLRDRQLDKLMLHGVTILDPSSTFIDDGVEIGPDTVVKPFTFLEGRTSVGSGCTIGPSTRIIDSVIGDGSTVEFSVIEDSRFDERVRVGPFNHIRPGTRLRSGVRVGNFAEIKNSTIGAGSKVPHHSYVGDTDVGEGVNMGAGCVTVNYDGKRKHRTVIGDGAFVGCNVNIIAPRKIGDRAYLAAGSTVHADVPPDALAIARAKQENKEGWVKRKMEEEQGR